MRKVKLDDLYNYLKYQLNLLKAEELGFKGANASNFAINQTSQDLLYNAGELPEITVTPGVKRKYIVDNGIKNIHHAPHNLPIVESDESKIATGMIGIPAAGIVVAPIAGSAGASVLNAIETFRVAHPFIAATADAGLAADGIINLVTDNGVTKTIRLAKEGKKGRAILSGLGDVADATGMFDIVRIGSKIANPLYRSAHAYNTIPQFGYENYWSRGKDWIKSILSGKNPNIIKEALWVDDLRIRLKEHPKEYGYLSELFKRNPEAAIEIAVRGRDEASRLYNRLPLRHNYYIPNGDGSYRYNLEKIQKDWKTLSGEDIFPLRYDDFYPDIPNDAGHKGIDIITGAGGNLTGNKFIGEKIKLGEYPNQEEFAIKQIEDWLDVHPFSRKGKEFSAILDSGLQRVTAYVRNKASKLYTKLHYATGGKDYYADSKLNRMWYNWLGGKYLNRLRYDFGRKTHLPGLTLNKDTYEYVPNDFWTKVNERMKKLELGKITGAKPFLMKTEIPTTLTFKQTIPNRNNNVQSLTDVLNSLGLDPQLILGHHSTNYVIPKQKYLNLLTDQTDLNSLNYLKFFK